MDRGNRHGIALLIDVALLHGGGYLTDSLNEAGTNGAVTAQAATITYPDSSNLGQFPAGYTFAFTDKDKIAEYRGTDSSDGDSEQKTDLERIKVDGSVHGSQTNPYVIANVNDWNNFSKYIFNDTDNGKGEYFALANDIDFSSVTNFHPVQLFQGTFYGLGHKLSNITSKTWKKYDDSAAIDTNTTWGFGLFCRVYNATITDLVVDNFLYKDFPQGKTTHQDRGSGIGAIAGYSSGNGDYFLNCHTSGTFDSNKQYTCHIPVGGIVGAGWGGSETTIPTQSFFYRCSSDVTVDILKNTTGIRSYLAGGIIGCIYLTPHTCYVYDCAAKIIVEMTSSFNCVDVFAGLITAITGGQTKLYVDGFVGKINQKLASNNTIGSGLFAGAWLPPGYTNTLYINFKDVYAEGTVTYPTAVYSAPLFGGACTVSNSNVVFTNANYLKTTVGTVRDTQNRNFGYDKCTDHGSAATLMSAAQAAVGDKTKPLSSKIWYKTNIGNYGIADSPVRNFMADVPTEVTLTYSGEAQNLANEKWYYDSVHGDPAIMSITSPTMVKANETGYEVIFILNSGRWQDGTTAPKKVKVKVLKKEITLNWDTSSGTATITSGIVGSDVAPKISYEYYTTENTHLSGYPTSIGTYKAVASLPADSNYKIKAGNEQSYFTLDAVPVDTPTVGGELSLPYTGKPQVFKLENDKPIDDGIIKPISQADMPAGATYNETDAGRTITVTDAGTYEIQFYLKSEENNTWSDGTGVLRLTIEPKPLTLSIARPAGKNWEFETNTQESFTITHNGVEGDNIDLAVTYLKPDNTTVYVKDNNITTVDNTITVTLDHLGKGAHTLTVGLKDASSTNKNGNYTLANLLTQDFTVKGKQATFTASDVSWQYSNGTATNPLTQNLKIPYSERAITVTIDEFSLADKGVRVLEYTNNLKTDAGKYTTSVTITKFDDSYVFTDATFSISWEIEKVKFDLSEVVWDYTEPIGYTGSRITVKLLNVPSQLTPEYTSNYATMVTGSQSNLAEVRFTCSNDNYVLPTKGQADTYIDNNPDRSGFPWTLAWYIKKGEINAVWDTYGGTHEDGSGNVLFNYPTIIGDNNRFTYKFYEAVRQGNDYQPASTPISINDITVTAGEEKYYFVEAVLTAAAAENYTLAEGNNPLRFVVGQSKTPVTVTLSESSVVYDGTAKSAEFEFSCLQLQRELTKEDFSISYIDRNGTVLASAPVNAGTYTVQFTIIGTAADDYYIYSGNRLPFTIEKQTVDISNVKWDYDSANPFVFTRKDGVDEVFTVSLTGIPAAVEITYTNNSASAAGTYTAGVSIDYDTENIEAFTLPTNLTSLEWVIKKRELKKPVSVLTGRTFDGHEYDALEIVGLDGDWQEYMNLTLKKGAETVSGTMICDAGSYFVTCSVLGSLLNNVEWQGGGTGGQSAQIEVLPRVVKVTGWASKPPVPLFDSAVEDTYYETFYKDADGNEVTYDEVNTTYNVKFRASVRVPADMTGNVLISFENGTDDFEFKIFDPNDPVTFLPKPELKESELFYEGEKTYVFELKKAFDRTNMIMTGSLTLDGIKKGRVTITLNGNQNVKWDDGTYGAIVLEFEVKRGKIEAVWDTTQSPHKLKIEGDMANAVEYVYVDQYNNEVTPDAFVEGETYHVIAKIKSDFVDKYGFWVDSAYDEELAPHSFQFKIVQAGDDGQDGSQGADGNTGDENRTDTSNLPIWQLIVGGVSLVLFVICTAKAVGDYGKYRTAKKDTRELVMVAYSVTPLPILAIAFLGMGETAWTAIALVALGLFLISFAAMIVFSKKRKKAELALARERARIAEEKEYAKELERQRREDQLREEQQRREDLMREEQARRDNELKMMFAAMQQGYQQPQPQMQYEDMRSLLADTINAILPAVQQMQALPPAQSDPAVYAVPQTGYNPSAETEALRAQMSEQQQRLEDKIAKQQELLEKLLNQSQQNVAPAYVETYDDTSDEASWFDESDEVISLEELYGELSDDRKRFYYEIGSYIMNKPRTSQNDGKYAVLFKYRGKTLFKLCIKDDAPVFYYVSESGGKSEVRIADNASLEIAKDIVDFNIVKTDNQFS